ncbi:MAG: hypothetical protein U0T69_11405 [Chitinophagales bacterium]
MATLKNAKFIKETDKAIQIEYWQKIFWIPKSLATVTNEEIEVVEWFYKKEIDWKITAKHIAYVLGLKSVDKDAEGLPAQLQEYFSK